MHDARIVELMSEWVSESEHSENMCVMRINMDTLSYIIQLYIFTKRTRFQTHSHITFYMIQTVCSCIQ